MERSGYAFEDRREEQRRLERQAELFDPLTEPVFRAAGLGPGMRVLDLGSGAGDVAMLAARMVGSTGGVLGVERDPAAVASATARVEQTGMPNVRFVEDDVQTLAAMEVSSMPSRDGWCSCTCPILPPHWRERWSCCGAGGLVCVQEGDMAGLRNSRTRAIGNGASRFSPNNRASCQTERTRGLCEQGIADHGGRSPWESARHELGERSRPRLSPSSKSERDVRSQERRRWFCFVAARSHEAAAAALVGQSLGAAAGEPPGGPARHGRLFVDPAARRTSPELLHRPDRQQRTCKHRGAVLANGRT